MHITIKPGLGIGRRLHSNIARIVLWWIKGKKECLLLNPADHNQRSTKVRLIGAVRRYPGSSEYARIFATLSRRPPKSRAI